MFNIELKKNLKDRSVNIFFKETLLATITKTEFQHDLEIEIFVFSDSSIFIPLDEFIEAIELSKKKLTE